MKKISVFTSPAKGHLYPMAPVLGELVARGHDVSVVTLPVCAELFGRDQAEVARKAVSNSAGPRVSPRLLNPITSRKALDRTRQCRSGADPVHTGSAVTGGAHTGADILERHLRTVRATSHIDVTPKPTRRTHAATES